MKKAKRNALFGVLSAILVAFGIVTSDYFISNGSSSPGNPNCGMNEQHPCYVQITEDQFEELLAVNKKQSITLVPGDLITQGTPFESSQIDTTGYSNSHVIFHVENTGGVKIKLWFKQTFGPIGSLTEVDSWGPLSWPIEVGESFVFKAENIPVFAQYAKAYYWIEDPTWGDTNLGEVDVNSKIVLF